MEQSGIYLSKRMANLTEQERDALQAIDCIGNTKSDVVKAIALMGFIYTLMSIILIKGLYG